MYVSEQATDTSGSMVVWTALEQVPGHQRSVVTIGNFDGMHQGHSRVIGWCVDRAKKLGVDSVALTFDPHPRSVHRPHEELSLINPLSERLDAMAGTGLDATLVATYDRSLFTLSAEDFVEEYLVDRLGAKEVVVGEDFRFGRGNLGNVDTLRKLGRQFGFDVTMVTDVVDGHGRRWSSSWVRDLLTAGNVSEAAEVLGRFHRVTGSVVHGSKRGRRLGFPTANVVAEGQLVPADGVYAGWLVRDAERPEEAEWGGGQEFLPAAISVGTNPQFGGTSRSVEAHVLGRSDLDLYGEEVTVVFVRRLRPMLSFDTVEELLERMDEDLRQTAVTLGVRTAKRVHPDAVTAGL